MNRINIESISDQDDANDMTDYTQDSDTSILEPTNDYDTEFTCQDNMDDFETLTPNDNNDAQDSDILASTTNVLPPLKSLRSSHTIKENNISQNTLNPMVSSIKKSLRSSVRKLINILNEDDAIENHTQDF
ncbi:9726_t:CDS:2 [Racocetra fulgida]|uniref:9726_t:CDS:1 n=1 Tax=Racocetra fulgida TaxID=60492 RepID=A0A9N9BVS7_9GLOM|nr:9726_t:CDS:2 [Racocetra fulgida]